METKLKFLSHASCIIETETHSLLFDPWLIGSCYWRSWWNYPPVNKESIESLNPDAIYITHVHWDHWHGPTLKKLFAKDTLIITHDEPNGRSVRDLRSIGFTNILLLKHGESVSVGNIKLTIYQFGLFLNDSAAVIETEDVKILNANDCKIAGPSLKQILNRHGHFDFALRSHSSANDRACYTIENSDMETDNPEHYTNAWHLFMEAVQPRFAIPFASNHVLLHKDVYHFNNSINDPFKLKSTLDSNYSGSTYEIKICLSGDLWSSKTGFRCNDYGHFYEQKDKYISEYRDSKNDVLEKYYNLESRIKISTKHIDDFIKLVSKVPRVLRKRFKGLTFTLKFSNNGKAYMIDPYKLQFSEVDYVMKAPNEIVIPEKIFIDSIYMNMFHHAGISKRNRYFFRDNLSYERFVSFVKLVELVELEVFPIKLKYGIDILKAYARRWRELKVYALALLFLKKGYRTYDVEEIILKKHS